MMTLLDGSSGQTIELRCHGQAISLTVDESSDYTGTTLWDSAVVLAKCMEHYFPIQTGLKGKKAIELGAGMGLAGIACALSGCNVVFTDVQDVLPALTTSVAKNLGQSNGIHVKELKWGNRRHMQAMEPPFDLVLAADCLFSMELVQPFMETITEMLAPNGVALIAVEIRSRSVCAEFLRQASQFFYLRKMPLEGLGKEFQHPAMAVWCLVFPMADPWWNVIRRWPVCNPQQEAKLLDKKLLEVVQADPPRLVETAQLQTLRKPGRKATDNNGEPTLLRKLSSWGTYGGTGKFGTFC